MNNRNRTLMILLITVIVLTVLLTAAVFFMPYLVKAYLDARQRTDITMTYLLAAFYACVPILYLLLGVLMKLLFCFKSGKVYSKANELRVRILSWCCFFVGGICLVGRIWYMPYLVMAPAALFTGLILAVLRFGFGQPSASKDLTEEKDNDCKEP